VGHVYGRGGDSLDVERGEIMGVQSRGCQGRLSILGHVKKKKSGFKTRDENVFMFGTKTGWESGEGGPSGQRRARRNIVTGRERLSLKNKGRKRKKKKRRWGDILAEKGYGSKAI